MKRVSYAGESFLTPDEVADALVDLTAALGRVQKAEAVELPALDDEGRSQPVRLVLGPASQILAVHEDTRYAEPDIGDTVERLIAKTRQTDARNIAVVAPAHLSTSAFFDIDDVDSA